MTEKPAINIDIISDVVCPWCFVGMKRLEQALELASDHLTARIRWLPYQLDPTIPPEGLDRQTYMAAKFSDPKRLQEIHQTLEHLGEGLGIRFHFADISVSPNTLNAHRLLHWAGETNHELQHRLAGLLFSLYFEQGENIGDLQVLVRAAGEIGMDETETEKRLRSGEDRDTIKHQIDHARQIGVTGVPCFILAQKYAVVGAQDPQQISNGLIQLAQEVDASHN